jgi:hypothetical protein
MDAEQFDALAHGIGVAATRRDIIAAVVATFLGANHGAGTVAPAQAQRRDRRSAVREHDRGRASDPHAKAGEGLSCALQRYETHTLAKRGLGESASHIDIRQATGRPFKDHNDVLFFPALNAMNTVAASHGVTLRVFSAYRNQLVQGKVNPEVKASNHTAGHAIDVDFVYPGGVCTWPCAKWKKNKKGKRTSVCLVRDPAGCLQQASDANKKGWKAGVATAGMQKLPAAVLATILDIEKAGYAWGGRFSSTGFDPIHFDDRINKKNPSLWKARGRALAQSEKYQGNHPSDCPTGQTCNLRTGVCEGPCQPGVSCGDPCDGVTCAACSHCVNGSCVVDCAADRCCNGQCVNTQTNTRHCGRCGRACGVNATCAAGECVGTCGAEGLTCPDGADGFACCYSSSESITCCPGGSCCFGNTTCCGTTDCCNPGEDCRSGACVCDCDALYDCRHAAANAAYTCLQGCIGSACDPCLPTYLAACNACSNGAPVCCGQPTCGL